MYPKKQYLHKNTKKEKSLNLKNSNKIPKENLKISTINFFLIFFFLCITKIT